MFLSPLPMRALVISGQVILPVNGSLLPSEPFFGTAEDCLGWMFFNLLPQSLTCVGGYNAKSLVLCAPQESHQFRLHEGPSAAL